MSERLKEIPDQKVKRESLTQLVMDLDAQFGLPNQAEIDHAVALLTKEPSSSVPRQ